MDTRDILILLGVVAVLLVAGLCLFAWQLHRTGVF
jgi:hypothetical protein